ncbi:MAG: ATP-binding protein [Myxococcaceae bacterium]|nr:ATP-binding protein [Myxococcaceae bacterium]
MGWAWLGLGIRLQVAWLVALVALGFLAELLAWRWQRTQVSENRILGLMVFDTLLHTGVFALSGGPFNPFTALYLVNVVLASLVLTRARQWTLVTVTLAAFAALFLVDEVAPAAWQLPNHAELMRLHLGGMWVAFVVAAGFIVSFVQRLLSALTAREAQLTEARRLAAQHEKLAALTTLAAGAAHELATPLGTLAVASAEMARALEQVEVPPGVKEDVALVREQVQRCRVILQGMSARSGELAGEAVTSFAAQAWLDDALEGLPDAPRVRIAGALSTQVRGPRLALTQALRNLVKNALEASHDDVTVEVTNDAGRLRVSVADRGAGLSAPVAARLGEPFFTTKPVGQGMGLGVFLTRTLAEQLGGSLTFESLPGRGTRASLELPREVTA